MVAMEAKATRACSYAACQSREVLSYAIFGSVSVQLTLERDGLEK